MRSVCSWIGASLLLYLVWFSWPAFIVGVFVLLPAFSKWLVTYGSLGLMLGLYGLMSLRPRVAALSFLESWGTVAPIRFHLLGIAATAGCCWIWVAADSWWLWLLAVAACLLAVWPLLWLEGLTLALGVVHSFAPKLIGDPVFAVPLIGALGLMGALLGWGLLARCCCRRSAPREAATPPS